MRLYIEPKFRGADNGEGGIRRVVEAQHRYLPNYDIRIVDSVADAEVVATHAGNLPHVPVSTPWAVHTHGLYWAEYEWPQWSLKMNREVIEAMRRADVVTAPSEWVAQTIRRGMLLRPEVLYHGINPEEWAGGSNAGYVLWNKTRVDPICDPAPVGELAQRAPDIRFVTTFGADLPNITLTGKLPYEHGRELIKHAAVYLCTTRETMGIGTLEAMAAGVPILGWKWGGQAEIIRQGETGWLSTPGDYDDLLKGLRYCLANRERMGRAAQDQATTFFTWEKAMQRYAELYHDLASTKAYRYGTQPAVSVIVPCYNLGRFLPQALDSLREQSFQDWQCIVVDDCSTDNTREIVAAYQREDSRIRYERTPQNLYLAGALNYGMGLADGRYLMALDADNMLAPDALATLAGALDGDRAVAIAYGAVRFVQEDGRTPDLSVGPDGISGWPEEFEFRRQIQNQNGIPSTALIRREVWERTGGYRRRWRTAEDADFWTRATSYGAVPRMVTRNVTLIYRQRADSMSRVEVKPDWSAWYPWSRYQKLAPFGIAADPPERLNFTWPVATNEPTKIAIVIPVGPGHEDLVIDALDSVDAQTFRQWECYVVNDTGRPLRYLPSWCKLLATEGGKGPAYCRNLAIQVSTAPLFVPLDADDYLQPDALDILYKTWLTERGVVYSQWYDDKGGPDVEIYDPPDYDASLLLKRGCIHAVTALYPRSAWVEVGGFDPAMPNWEDWDFQIALAARGICGTKVPVPLFTYRKMTGRRREENAAKFEAGKEAVLNKWGRFWRGDETLMGCSSCPGGGGRRTSAPGPITYANMPSGRSAERAAALAAPAQDGAVLLEFLDPSEAAISYRSRVDNQYTYRFANSDGLRIRWVLEADAEWLLSLDGKFRRVESSGIEAGPDGTALAPRLQTPATSAPRSEMAPAMNAGGGGAPVAVAPRPGPSSAQPPAPAVPSIVSSVLREAGAASGGGSVEQFAKPPQEQTDAESIVTIRANLPTMSDQDLAERLTFERNAAEPKTALIKLLEQEQQARQA